MLTRGSLEETFRDDKVQHRNFLIWLTDALKEMTLCNYEALSTADLPKPSRLSNHEEGNLRSRSV
jgi:hypothetical protein